MSTTVAALQQMKQAVHVKLNPSLPWQKAAFNKKKAFFHQ
jgi:hypothetical protein